MKTWIRFKENLIDGFRTMLVILIMVIAVLWPVALSAILYRPWPLLIYTPYAPILYAIWKTFIEERWTDGL